MSIEEGWQKVTDNHHVFVTETPYGMIVLTARTGVLEQVFSDVFFSFLSKIEGIPTNKEEAAQKTGVLVEDILDLEITIKNGGDLINEVHKLIDVAVDHFSMNAKDFFIDGLQRYVEESIVKALLARSNEGYYNFNTTDLKAFDKIIKLHVQDLKKKNRAEKASGKVTSWTPEKRKEVLDFYETSFKTIKEAKTYIELLKRVDEMENGKSNSRSDKNKAAKKENFKKKMKAKFADLPEEVIENIITNIDDEPGFLARKCVGEKFNLKGLDYISTILTQARDKPRRRRKSP